MLLTYILSVLDVSKVDRGVASVAMTVYICCKGLLPMFYLSFQTYDIKCVYLNVAYVSHIYCMCFIWMLRMFAKGFKCFQVHNK
jgi:hypothetical protein